MTSAKKIILRTFKYLAMLILAVLFILLTTIALLHLSIIQKKITPIITGYLATKFHSEVEISRIKFSILGNFEIEKLVISDRAMQKIFSVDKINLTSNLLYLATGNLTFDDLQIIGLDGNLIQRSNGWNIQPIIDALQSNQQGEPQSTDGKLTFQNILLQGVVVGYTSEVDSSTLTFDVDIFSIHDTELSVHPGRLSAGKIILKNSIVKILSHGQRNPRDKYPCTSIDPPSLDLGTGMVFDITSVIFENNKISYHKNFETLTDRFDPSHVDLEEINMNLSRILIHEDTIAGNLQSLSILLPGFILESSADIHLNRNLIDLSGINVWANSSQFNADINGRYDVTSANESDISRLHIRATTRFKPGDFSYFFRDPLPTSLDQWEDISVDVDGNFSMKIAEIKELKMSTKESYFHASGVVHNILDREKLHWQDLKADGFFGSDVRLVIAPIIGGIKLPKTVGFRVKASGHPGRINFDANINTAQGILSSTGSLGLNKRNTEIQLNIKGEKVDLGEFLDLPWLGQANLTMNAKGTVGQNTNLKIQGDIDQINIQDQSVEDIAFSTNVTDSKVTSLLSVDDPNYRSKISSEISFLKPLTAVTVIHFTQFNLGGMLRMDNALLLSGDLEANTTIGENFAQNDIAGKNIQLSDDSREYLLDTLSLAASTSSHFTLVTYFDDYTQVNLSANFDVSDLPKVATTWGRNLLRPGNGANLRGDRFLHGNIHTREIKPLQLFGVDIEDLASLYISAEYDERKHIAGLTASAADFKGYGISADTFRLKLATIRDSAFAEINGKNLLYNSIHLGNLNFGAHTVGDTAVTTLSLLEDSTSIFNLTSLVLRSDSGALAYPVRLQAFENEYTVDRSNPVHITDENVALDDFMVTREHMKISLDGDLNAFDLNLKNLDLTILNKFLSPDSAIVNSGSFNAKISYESDGQIYLTADIDSLCIYGSTPLKIGAKAVSDNTNVPFEFIIIDPLNKIDINGQYNFNTKEVDASMLIGINDLETFGFLTSEFLEDLNGKLIGNVQASGHLQNPRLNGSLRFTDATVTTLNPEFTFNVDDGSVELNNSTLLLRDFTIFDPDNNVLTVNGHIGTSDYQSLDYELHLKTEEFTLVDNPDSVNSRLTGTLVVGSEIDINGNDRGSNVKANITIKDTTALTYTQSNDDIKILNSEGIIEFIDPIRLADSSRSSQSTNFYDSLIASLPEFKLNSLINIEEDAQLRYTIDALSGDYIEASGGGTLDLEYDRTGNVRLSGSYTIKEGLYRVSFYDLVKKNFRLLPGSSINWNGSPEDGDLKIKAVYAIKTSSIGLIGNEISENEKSIYKRALPYDVGINIDGTLEKPEISFSLDLPHEEKVNYPVLANKLEKLKQPEYQSELNKQVFAVLVLGGFMPETSGFDINQNTVATTALYNSVNSLLSTQLNQFANRYITGLDIDVGIQSYSDNAASGKTRTAMDFRVTKRMMNDRLSFEFGGDFNINQDQSGSNSGDNFRGDIGIVYDLTEQGNKRLKLFNNETYDIIYQEIRNTGVSLIFIREFDKARKSKNEGK